MKIKIQDILTKFNQRLFGLKGLNFDEKIDGFYYCLAEKSDIFYLLAIERDVYDGDTPWTYSHFEFEIEKNPNANFLIAAKNDKPIAFIGTRIDFHEDSIHITNLAVKKEFQHRGIAKNFLAQIEDLCEKLGINKISLEVKLTNQVAQALYRSNGFLSEKILPEYYDDGSDGLWMEKNLLDDEN